MDTSPNGRQNKSHKLYFHSLCNVCSAPHETINNKLEGDCKPNQVISLEDYGWGEEAFVLGQMGGCSHA